MQSRVKQIRSKPIRAELSQAEFLVLPSWVSSDVLFCIDRVHGSVVASSAAESRVESQQGRTLLPMAAQSDGLGCCLGPLF